MLWHREPYTLAQIEKQMGKKDFEEAVGNHVIRQQGKPALVSENDSRPEYIVKTQRKILKRSNKKEDIKNGKQ